MPITAPGTYSGSVSAENSSRLPGNGYRTMAYAARSATRTLISRVSPETRKLHHRLSPKLPSTYWKFCTAYVPPGPLTEEPRSVRNGRAQQLKTGESHGSA